LHFVLSFSGNWELVTGNFPTAADPDRKISDGRPLALAVPPSPIIKPEVVALRRLWLSDDAAAAANLNISTQRSSDKW
jgi:hypothetical protein